MRLSEELVEQQLEMTDIHLPQCERVILIPEPISLGVQMEEQHAQLWSYRAPAVSGQHPVSVADERLWPRVVEINPQLFLGS